APVALLPWFCTKLVAPFLSSSFAPGIAAPLASVTVPTSAPADAVCACAGVNDKGTRNAARTAKLKRKPRIMTRPSFSGGSFSIGWGGGWFGVWHIHHIMEINFAWDPRGKFRAWRTKPSAAAGTRPGPGWIYAGWYF